MSVSTTNVEDIPSRILAQSLAMQQLVSELRMLLRTHLRPTGSSEVPPLRDALIGQKSDSSFYNEWETHKKQVSQILDVLDVTYPTQFKIVETPRVKPGQEEYIASSALKEAKPQEVELRALFDAELEEITQVGAVPTYGILSDGESKIVAYSNNPSVALQAAETGNHYATTYATLSTTRSTIAMDAAPDFRVVKLVDWEKEEYLARVKAKDLLRLLYRSAYCLIVRPSASTQVLCSALRAGMLGYEVLSSCNCPPFDRKDVPHCRYCMKLAEHVLEVLKQGTTLTHAGLFLWADVDSNRYGVEHYLRVHKPGSTAHQTYPCTVQSLLEMEVTVPLRLSLLQPTYCRTPVPAALSKTTPNMTQEDAKKLTNNTRFRPQLVDCVKTLAKFRAAVQELEHIAGMKFDELDFVKAAHGLACRHKNDEDTSYNIQVTDMVPLMQSVRVQALSPEETPASQGKKAE